MNSTRVFIEQRGTMRLKPRGAWLPFSAQQWAATRRVEFRWRARVKMAPLVTAVVTDAFDSGKGRLEAKLWGALRVAHDAGPEIDRGEIQRYLAELPWNPLALLRNQALRFEERDGAVRVWTREPSLYVDFIFDADGDVVRTLCDNRPLQGRGRMGWEGHFSRYAQLGPFRTPTHGEVAWLLPEGMFEYWRGDVTSLQLAKP